MPRVNYLLIDYENVQPKGLSLLTGFDFRVLVFIGANQSKIPVELAKTLQSLGENAEYIQIAGNGSNALDFHIAFTVGELSKISPDAYFHIISKDSGFDPLIRYAKQKNIKISRSKEISDIPLLKISNAKSLTEKADAIVTNLVSRGNARPRKVRTLKNSINALFLKALGEQELDGLVQELLRAGHISIEHENVTYHFQAAT